MFMRAVFIICLSLLQNIYLVQPYNTNLTHKTITIVQQSNISHTSNKKSFLPSSQNKYIDNNFCHVQNRFVDVIERGRDGNIIHLLIGHYCV